MAETLAPAGDPPRTLFDKLWAAHAVADLPDGRTLVHIDRHLLHDLSSPQAFAGLREAGRRVRNPERTFAMSDHVVDTRPGRGDATVPGGTEMIVALRHNARDSGIRHFDVGDADQGIVHIVAAEQGLVLPGMSVVCGDSHACTLGALGAWAWGVGTSEVEHVLATQTLALHRPQAMRITLNGRLAPGVGAKDLALHLIRNIGVRGAATGFLELDGALVRALPMEARFTLCNMAIECGARAGVIAPDDTTFDYVRQRVPALPAWDEALRHWRSLASDPGARYQNERVLEVALDAPQFTWGTNPSQVVALHEPLPDPASATSPADAAVLAQAQAYMGLRPGQRLQGLPVDRVFIGSCTNARLSDLQAAADVVRGRRVAAGVQALVVPGSMAVRRAAEALGLDQVFTAAGFEWRMPGCSMCVGMNADQVGAGERCVATSNRNFEGRQGPGARTHLASPASAAAAAIAGHLVDHRELTGGVEHASL